MENEMNLVYKEETFDSEVCCKTCYTFISPGISVYVYEGFFFCSLECMEKYEKGEE